VAKCAKAGRISILSPRLKFLHSGQCAARKVHVQEFTSSESHRQAFVSSDQRGIASVLAEFPHGTFKIWPEGACEWLLESHRVPHCFASRSAPCTLYRRVVVTAAA